MTQLQKVTKDKPLVIGKKAESKESPQTVEERLAAMEASIAEIKEMLKKALG